MSKEIFKCIDCSDCGLVECSHGYECCVCKVGVILQTKTFENTKARNLRLR